MEGVMLDSTRLIAGALIGLVILLLLIKKFARIPLALATGRKRAA